MDLTRRQFLKTGALGVAAAALTWTSPLALVPTPALRIALLHLAPIPADLAHNRDLVEAAVTTAAGLGADWIITPAAWAPGLHGPDGEWERCTRDTGLPLLVCNRTGPDKTLDFSGAESVIVKEGQRLLTLRAERSAIFTVEWDLRRQTLTTHNYQRTNL